MKATRILSVLACAFFVVYEARPQGSGIVNFANTGQAPDRRIYGVEGPASGTAYSIALYWGQPGTPEQGLVQVGAGVGFLTGVAAGTFIGGHRTLAPLPVNGAVATFQARAWCTDGGRFNSYEEALVLGGVAGKGPIFDLKTKDPANPQELPPMVGAAAGWRGFMVARLDGGGVCIPEPSSIILVGVAAAVLLLLRSREVGRV